MLEKRQSRLGKIKINQCEYMLFEEIGRGAASICYRGISDGKKYVIKEFYPMQIAIRNDEGAVIPLKEEGYNELFNKEKKSFKKAAVFHKEKLHEIQQNDFLSVIDIDEENGYVVMNDTAGQTLSEWAKKHQVNDEYIRECVAIIKGIIDEVEKYHKSGYVHLDLKAENIYKFDIENNQVLTRIFDFDSIQKIDTLYEDIQNKTAHIHTTNECYGKEIKRINDQSVDGITKEMITRLDYYAVAKILYYLIYRRYEKSTIDDITPFEEYYGKCTVLNNYLHNLFEKLCADIEKRDYSSEDIKSYLDKLLFIIDNRKQWDMYSVQNLKNKFKSCLMSDILVSDTHYTTNRGISAVEQVDAKYRGNLFLHGYDGGRGKTTAMKWLMFRKMGELDSLYLYFPLCELRPFKGEEIQCYEYVKDEICNRYKLNDLQSSCTLLLDGYNEIENNDVKETFNKFFRVIKESQYRIIISSRCDEEDILDNLICCTLTGISDKEFKKRKNDMLNLNDNLRTNPMIVELYSGIDMKNISSHIMKRLVGVVDGDEIVVNSTGEALWNYFIIQIYEKSKGDERAAEEYERFLFEILPKVAEESGYSGVNLDDTTLSDVEKKIFKRCNDLFRLMECQEDEDEENKWLYKFVHQNYYDFFRGVSIMNESDESIIEITFTAAELMGSVYCEPIEESDKIIVPKGYVDSYYGNGKEIVESDKEIKYAAGRNLILENLELMRNNYDIDEYTIESFIENLPMHHMNYSNLNIGWLLPHDEGLYDEIYGFYCGCYEMDNDKYKGLPVTYAAKDSDNFDNICFDGSLIMLQDDADQFITNCSFNNLKEGSILGDGLSSKEPMIQIGNCIYTEDRKVLLDYVGPEIGKDEIFLFEETEKISYDFKIHCKNPDAKIINQSKHFTLKDKALYDYFYDCLVFCQRDIETLILDGNIEMISDYACAYCKKIKTVDVQKIIAVQKYAFVESNIYDMIVDYNFFRENDVVLDNITRLTIWTLKQNGACIDLSMLRNCDNLKEIKIAYYNEAFTGSTMIPCVIRRRTTVEEIKYIHNVDINDVEDGDWEGYIKKHCGSTKEYMQMHHGSICCGIEPEDINNEILKNVIIYVPFEPDRDRVFGIKVKYYDQEKENENC